MGEACEARPPKVLFACVLGALAEIGILSQGTVNLAVRNAAPRIVKHLVSMGFKLPPKSLPLAEAARIALEELNRVLEAWRSFRVAERDGVVEICVDGGSCQYCPKRVGMAEIPGTACPFPALLRELLREAGYKVDLVMVNGRQLVKRGGWCCWLLRGG